VRDTHCNGDSWSHGSNMPICTKNTCDKSAMLEVPYGQGKSLMHGAVFKYRCNPGAQMEGGDTVACTGLEWTGSVPQCNLMPSQPSLELIVRGNVVSQVRHNDWVLVSCQGRGGHPPPEIGLRFDGKPFATKDFRVWRNTFTFIAKSSDNGKKIECTAANKVGNASSVSELIVLSAPSSVKISGPDTINHNSNYTYSCKVEGGNPRPTMRWKVNDVSMSGEEVEERLTRLAVVTGEEERTMTVSCIAENSLGVVSRSLHVDREYLPQRIMIQAPATIMEGEEAAVSCLTSQSHPAPRVTWKLEKVGATHEIREKVSGETTLVVGHEGEGDGGRLYRAGFVIEASEDISFVEVSCRAVVEGLGEVDSDIMKIMVEKRPEEEEKVEYSTPAYPEIINEVEQKNRAAITDLNTGEIIAVGDDEEDSESSDEYAEDVTNPAVEAEETTPGTTEHYEEEVLEEEQQEVLEEEQEEQDATGPQKADNFVKLVRADGEEVEEMDGTKEKENPWIPFDDNKNILEYQDQIEIEAEREDQTMEGFYQAQKLTEPKHASDKKTPIMMIDPPSSVLGSGASSSFNYYFVRFTLTVTLSSALALQYLYKV